MALCAGAGTFLYVLVLLLVLLVVVPFSGADALQVYTQGNPYGLDQDLVYSMPLRSKVGYLT